MWLLLGCLMAAAVPVLGRDCEKMKVPFCSKMPYEELRLPNLFGHTSQDEVNMALEPLQQLQSSGCFGHYSFTLCTALAPPCIPNVQTPAPCRRVCERARDRCYGLMLMYNVTESWPDCDKLPKDSSDPLCMMPTSVTPRDNCHCLKKHQPEMPTIELMNDRDYDFSMKARMDGFAPSHFPSILSVTVLDIFRDGLVELNVGNTSFLVTNTSCKCPELETGKEYLIMGKEDFNKSELLLGKETYVVPWTDPIKKDYGEPARTAYQDPERRSYSRHYTTYTNHHGYHLGFSRPSASNLLMAGGAYALYRHYKNKKKVGKVYGYPGYGGSAAFGALGGGGFGALGNPRGTFTNYNNFASPGAAPAFGGGGAPNYGYGYGNYNNANRYGQSGAQVPSYPITHKPNFATNRPGFANQPSYPVTNRPSYPVTNRPSYPVTTRPSYPVTSKPYRTVQSQTYRSVNTGNRSPSYPVTKRPYRAPTRRTTTRITGSIGSRGGGRNMQDIGTPSDRHKVDGGRRWTIPWTTPRTPWANQRTTPWANQRTTPRSRIIYPVTRNPVYPTTPRYPVYPSSRSPRRFTTTRRPASRGRVFPSVRRTPATRRPSSRRSNTFRSSTRQTGHRSRGSSGRRRTG